MFLQPTVGRRQRPRVASWFCARRYWERWCVRASKQPRKPDPSSRLLGFTLPWPHPGPSTAAEELGAGGGCYGSFPQVVGQSNQPVREEGAQIRASNPQGTLDRALESPPLNLCSFAYVFMETLPPPHFPTSCQRSWRGFCSVTVTPRGSCFTRFIRRPTGCSAGQHFLVCSLVILKATVQPAWGLEMPKGAN